MRVAPVLGILVVAVVVGLVCRSSARSTPQPSARALEATLLAPCCFGGTLDVHDSNIARDLRLEIEARVTRGESTASIEDDLVARYGPRVRAMPNEGLFGATIAVALAGIALGAFGVALLVRGWRRDDPDRRPQAPASPLEARDGYDERIDDELDVMDLGA